MRVAIIYNKSHPERDDVINFFGPQTKETYNLKTIDLVTKALSNGGHCVKQIEGSINVAGDLKNFLPRITDGESPGMVFNMAYGIQGHSRYSHIPALLEMVGVPYVGSGPAAHVLALDKVLSKVIFQRNNISTPAFWIFSSAEAVSDDVSYPAIVKPKMEAVSMGLRLAHNKREVAEAVDHIVREFHQQALVESFIPGREFAVGLLGNQDPEIFPILEIDLDGDPNAIQSHDDKLHAPRKKICPSSLPDETASEMRLLARLAFHSLGLYDFARVDFRIDRQGRMYVLEINSMASLGMTGSYVQAAGVAGYSYDALINRMLDVSAIRYFGESSFRPIKKSEGLPKKHEF